MGWWLGIDTGGTFTDVVGVCSEGGEWRVTKIWSDPTDTAGMIEKAILELGVTPSEIEAITYGTTQVTNALVEGRSADVAMFLTRGFGDVLTIARQKREPLYNIKPVHRPSPPVRSDAIFEVEERRDHLGNEVTPLDEGAFNRLLDSVPAECKAAAIIFLHSYRNGASEERAAEIAKRRFRYVAMSHDVSPEAREYERSLTTALSAGLLPLMEKFVASLKSRTVIPVEKLRFFHSAGGLISIDTVARYPLLLAMSGPAAGVTAATKVAKELSLPKAVSVDMGGTTTDCSLFQDGKAAIAGETRIGDHVIRQPMISVESIGAGGGSIVKFEDGHLMVGPESAGAKPGPAAYGRGGMQPTLTDAAAVLGYFGATTAERALSIDIEAARRSFAGLASDLNTSIEDVAKGTIAVASALAARAIKRVTMSNGADARSCAMIAFGGAGPMFGGFIADEIGMATMVVPFGSSALSATGCLVAQPSVTKQWTLRIDKASATHEKIASVIPELVARIESELQGAKDAGDRTESFVALVRYPGQSYEVEVPFVLPFDPDQLSADFDRAHEAAYGFKTNDDWEIVSIRATLVYEGASAPIIAPRQESVAARDMGTARCYFADGWHDVPQFDRASFAVGSRIAGPGIILDNLSTILVLPDRQAEITAGQHIIIKRGEGK